MTPLERLIDSMTTAARMRAWYASAEWERKTRAVIDAMAESQRRSIGQRIRFIAARAASKLNPPLTGVPNGHAQEG